MLRSRHSLAAHKGWSPELVNLGILAGGLALGMVSYAKRDTPLGAVLLQAGGSVVAVSLIFLVHDLLVPASR
jgi:hypothetical protein